MYKNRRRGGFSRVRGGEESSSSSSTCRREIYWEAGGAHSGTHRVSSTGDDDDRVMQISCKSAETQQQQSHPSSLSLSWFRRRRRRRLRILGEIQLWCFSFRPNRSYWFELILYTITYCIKENGKFLFLHRPSRRRRRAALHGNGFCHFAIKERGKTFFYISPMRS